MAEGGGLENRYACKGIVSSNLTPTANNKSRCGSPSGILLPSKERYDPTFNHNVFAGNRRTFDDHSLDPVFERKEVAGFVPRSSFDFCSRLLAA